MYELVSFTYNVQFEVVGLQVEVVAGKGTIRVYLSLVKEGFEMVYIKIKDFFLTPN